MSIYLGYDEYKVVWILNNVFKLVDTIALRQCIAKNSIKIAVCLARVGECKSYEALEKNLSLALGKNLLDLVCNYHAKFSEIDNLMNFLDSNKGLLSEADILKKNCLKIFLRS